MMTIGRIPVKRTYKLARIISDVISLGEAALILYMTITFFPRYKEAINTAPNRFELLAEYREKLATRQYFAWIFPAIVPAVFAAYLILVLKSHKFAKYNITKQNAQSVYDWYAFAVSLCKLPLLLAVFDMMNITQQRLMFNNVSIFSFQIILDVFVTAIIIRLSVHRIRALTAKEDTHENETSGGVKARLADDDDDDEKD